jgi:undecaprenyl-diphosphatase
VVTVLITTGLRKILDVLRQPEPVVLLAMLAVMAGVLIFAAVADEVAERDTQHFDERVLRSLRSANDSGTIIGPAWMAAAARDISSLGGTTLLMSLTAGTAGFLFLCDRRRAMWLVLLAPATGTLASVVLKVLFARPRPAIVPHLETVTSYSFPSGHSMLSAIVYLTLGALVAGLLPRRSQKVYVMLAAVTITLLVGTSRMLLGVHYPTDILAGWSAGAAWAVLWWLIERRLQSRP